MSVALQLDGIGIPLAPGETLFAAAARAGIPVPSSCRGQGKCRECLLEIASGQELLGKRTAEETHLSDQFRLSCCARPLPDAPGGIIEAKTLRRTSLRVEQGAVAPSRLARLESGGTDRPVSRDGDRVLVEGREVARHAGPIHGLAMDLGTTTVVVRCVNLETGEIVATSAFENPQRFGGSDVMARIQYDVDHPGRMLQRTLLGYLSRSIAEMPVPGNSIFELTVAANTTMRDLFFGFDVRGIGQKPYRSETEHAFRAGLRGTTAIETSARSLRLPLHPAARVCGLPLIGGHVGGDAAACLLALQPHRSDAVVAIMDIGTNTELVFGNRQRLLAASCPAGPAFEGRAIQCGMPGLDGAIAHVRLDDAGAIRERDVLGGGKPLGICGSGLVDLLGELRRTGRINELGRFVDGSDCFVVDEAQAIAFRESDINELAQAKGANVAGLEIVAKRYGIPLTGLDRFYLAGGFGRHLDPASARRIGLIPNLPETRIEVVGNAAIEGATLALLSLSLRRELEQIVRTVEHVELETDPDFFELFVSGCQFAPIGSEAGREVPA